MPKTFGFGQQKRLGDNGEAKFLEKYAQFGVKKCDGRQRDFEWQNLGIELKSDYYTGTPNFFIERFSDISTKKEGGPWRAISDSCEFFVYFFVLDDQVHWFKSKPLVDWLEKNLTSFKKRTILNKNYKTEGYLVPKVEMLKIELDFSGLVAKL